MNDEETDGEQTEASEEGTSAPASQADWAGGRDKTKSILAALAHLRRNCTKSQNEVGV